MNAELFQQLVEENKKQKCQIHNLQQQIEQYQQAYESLQHQLNELKRFRFGPRSERFIDSNNPQLNLFEELPTVSEEPEPPEIEVPAHRRRKRAPKDTSKYPRIIEIIPLPEADRVCPCGCEKKVIRYETKELLDYQPAVFRIIEQRREVMVCSKTHCPQSTIQIAPPPPHILPKTKATEALLAHIMVSKLHHRQPLYHLEKYVKAMNVSRETMARWMIQLVEPLRPVWNLMKDEIIDYDVAALDATTLQVLKEPGRPPEKKSYLYCFRGGRPGREVVLYEYNHSDHKQFVDQWFEGFYGTLHVDADPFFETLFKDPKVFPSYCHAHSRRKFEAVKKQAKKQGLAHEALRFYKKIYKIERQAKKQQLTPEQRLALRQEKTAPMMAEFKAWLDAHYPHVLRKSPLGKAFHYLISRWEEGFLRFLEDGRIEVDNNLTEQEIKPIVTARKNFIFADTMTGAEAICIEMSFIRTALLYKLDPQIYIETLLQRIPYCQTVEDYEKLLPWNIDLDDTS